MDDLKMVAALPGKARWALYAKGVGRLVDAAMGPAAVWLAVAVASIVLLIAALPWLGWGKAEIRGWLVSGLIVPAFIMFYTCPIKMKLRRSVVALTCALAFAAIGWAMAKHPPSLPSVAPSPQHYTAPKSLGAVRMSLDSQLRFNQLVAESVVAESKVSRSAWGGDASELLVIGLFISLFGSLGVAAAANHVSGSGAWMACAQGVAWCANLVGSDAGKGAIRLARHARARLARIPSDIGSGAKKGARRVAAGWAKALVPNDEERSKIESQAIEAASSHADELADEKIIRKRL